MAAYIGFGIEARHILTAVIMTAPGSILLSKILVPETETPETYGTAPKAESSTDANVLDAAARGTRDGLHLALNIGRRADLIPGAGRTRQSWAKLPRAPSVYALIARSMAQVGLLAIAG